MKKSSRTTTNYIVAFLLIIIVLSVSLRQTVNVTASIENTEIHNEVSIKLSNLGPIDSISGPTCNCFKEFIAGKPIIICQMNPIHYKELFNNDDTKSFSRN